MNGHPRARWLQDAPPLGATVQPDGSVRFGAWAPRASRVDVRFIDGTGRVEPMHPVEDGVFQCTVANVSAGTRYVYGLDGTRERPDPASRFQPDGVHGPSCVVNPGAYSWTDAGWRGHAMKDLVIYELHVGTFTPEGTFDAIIPRLPYFEELGVNALELMPVAAFPGSRNWGYDGVHPYAVQTSYGGPDGLRRLVDACHGAGLSLILDVVYNHLGPEGNYLAEFGPYFSRRHRTPWGEAINFDGAGSDGVRSYFIENALYWLTEFHVDGLRLDAVQEIFDSSPVHFLRQLREQFVDAASRLGRHAVLIAESNQNDVRTTASPDSGGHGMDAQWSDDFHHAMRAALTGERHGYFADFGKLADVRKAIVEGFVNDSRRSVYRGRRHGTSSVNVRGDAFVVSLQTHDQVANTTQGRRISELLDLEQQKLATALWLCAPNVPMFFMGQEFGTRTPFHYFISHGDPQLVEAVRAGRRAEYVKHNISGDFPDPQDEGTFAASVLDWSRLPISPHRELLALHRELLALRRRHACLSNCRKDLARVTMDEAGQWLVLERADPSGSGAFLVCNFAPKAQAVPLPRLSGTFQFALDTSEERFAGPRPSAHPARWRAGDAPALICPARSACLYVGE